MSEQNHSNKVIETKEQTHEVDESLYSRQLYVLGHEAMKRMAQSPVLIVGLNGVGIEVAKNVILQGVKSVTLADTKTFTYFDFTSQFYSGGQVGKSRLEVSLDRLRDLNPHCPVSIYKDVINEEYLKKSDFKVVVFCDDFLTDLIEMNKLCRELGIKFIAVESRGLAGCIFNDFGSDFEVLDTDGEQPVTGLIVGITNSNPGVISVNEENKHGLYDGELVIFDGIEGMTELNKTKEPIAIKSTGLHTFTIGDTTNFGRYVRGGYFTQVKERKKMNFISLEDALKKPNFVITDFAKFTRPDELHIAFQALSSFHKSFSRFPKPYNKEDADEFFSICKKISGKDDLPKDILNIFSYTCQGRLNPMAAFLGGYAAQEVQKACSGKFTPIDNFLYFDAFECLPKELPEEKDCQPLNCRYDGQIVVFGNKFQEKLLKQKYFIVGAGALGCEYLKNFAMMGLGCSKEGKCVVTDMDQIEISNLNRQFLFRTKHLKELKSEVATSVAKEVMNNDLNTKVYQEKVGQDTEKIFNEDFWNELDFVVNALDNVTARKYVDSKCVEYKKALFEAGTLGAKANCQDVIPNMTESYGSSSDPPEKEIPICTLKNFPNQIEHTIQYARDLFEGYFKQGISDANIYIKDPKEFQRHLKEQGLSKNQIIKTVYENLVTSKPSSYEECVLWARIKFDELFYNQIAQLLFSHPEDSLTKEGAPFWGGGKKMPTPIVFDPKDKEHLLFVFYAANLRAFNYGIQHPKKLESFDFVKYLSSVQLPKFNPKSGVKIATKKEELEEQVVDDDDEAQKLLEKLPKDLKVELIPADFEKDDDSNFHIDFVTSGSNLRAQNYKIPTADRHKTKGISGKIIPAMVTTTCLITGLASFEIYKYIQGDKKLEEFKNIFINIAINFIGQSEPIANTSIWESFKGITLDIGKDFTLSDLLNKIKEVNKNQEIEMMTFKNKLVYNKYGNKDEQEKRKLKNFFELLVSIEEPADKKLIDLSCVDENSDDVDVRLATHL